MTYLLDTYYMLWAIADTNKLSKPLWRDITNPENHIIVSTISFWEVSLKSSLGKLVITGFSPEDLPGACLQVGFEIEGLSEKENSTYHNFTAKHHKNPFNRMLVWQAMCNNYTLISADSNIKKYASGGLQVIP